METYRIIHKDQQYVYWDYLGNKSTREIAGDFLHSLYPEWSFGKIRNNLNANAVQILSCKSINDHIAKVD